ncbi:twin-arginine translocase TatA/TatE family subunit [Aerophototrophica crusticola]|uniref:twin-arginine translocase TatA/TatE family subunit n=1 Tax=Aerophototrophica crusticola TaxID=1709002 RepID=UPI00384A97DF
MLLLFGAGKLPRVMGDLAKGMKNFKQNLKEGEETEAVDAGRAIRSDTAVPPASTQGTASKEEAKG